MNTINRHLKRWCLSSALYLIFLFHIPYALSSDNTALIFPEQSLSFGVIAIGNKKEISSITIQANGETYSNNQIHILQVGHPAIFSLVNYPANTQLNVIATIATAEMDKSSGKISTMRLTQLTTTKLITTDGTGFASIIVGGTLQTSGPASNSDDAGIDYSAQIVLDIHY